MFVSFPFVDYLEEEVYNVVIKCSSCGIILLATSGLIIIYRLKKTGIKIKVGVNKHTFCNTGVNNYIINYTVDNKTYVSRVSENDCRKKEVEILVSKKYPWVMLDKFQTSGIVIFTLILLIMLGSWSLILYI